VRQAHAFEFGLVVQAEGAGSEPGGEDDGARGVDSVIGGDAPVGRVLGKAGDLGNGEFRAPCDCGLQQLGGKVGAVRVVRDIVEGAEVHEFATAAHSVDNQAAEAGIRSFRRSGEGTIEAPVRL
jgi:hypothetical protein